MTENEINEASQPPTWLNCVIVWGVCVGVVAAVGWTAGWFLAPLVLGVLGVVRGLF